MPKICHCDLTQTEEFEFIYENCMLSEPLLRAKTQHCDERTLVPKCVTESYFSVSHAFHRK